MILLPDPPDIARTLATGYPYPSPYPKCSRCGETDDVYYLYNDEQLCTSCMENQAREDIGDMDINMLAQLLDAEVVDAGDLIF